MKVSEQSAHLFLREAAGKGRHETFAAEYDTSDLCIACLRAAGQDRVGENPVKTRRDFLQPKIVVFVAVDAPNLVKMLPLRLLRRQ